MNGIPFPAVLIGGPPHSGKSVLVYSLTRALRAAGVAHYVLRACPDGEGDWSNESDQETVREIRSKGAFSPAFVDSVAGYLQQRHLPLLVDVGGRPTEEQEAIFSYCTHAILLIGDGAFAEDTAVWQAIARRQQLPVIAHLKSTLHGSSQLTQDAPIVTGTISGLERGTTAGGPVFSALVTKLAALFAWDQVEMTAVHMQQAPAELTLDLPSLAHTLGAVNGRWLPAQLPDLLAYLPAQKELALYGRAPNWIYAALAALASPAPVWLFDARLGWIQPPTLPLVDAHLATGHPAQSGWQTRWQHTGAYIWLEMLTHGQYLDYDHPQTLPLPCPGGDEGIVFSGKVPHWLLLAAVRQLGDAYAWTAVYQPMLEGAIVIDSTHPQFPVGKVFRALPAG